MLTAARFALQFDECKEATVLNWLPSKLGPQIRCIFSMIDETPQHQTLHSRPNKPLEVYVTPLDMSSREVRFLILLYFIILFIIPQTKMLTK